MEYIKEYNKLDIDPFNEEDWNELETDGTFLIWLKNKYPDKSKWKDIESINCYSQKLTDLIGIEKLINLKILFCNFNKISKLDITKNINLKELYCNHNQLRELDTSKNLKYLYCDHNQLTELDLTKNIKLIHLHCHYNQLRELNINKNVNLIELYCYDNILTKLDVTKNVNLINSFWNKYPWTSGFII